MTKCVANVLVDHGCVNQKELALQFVKEYYTDPRRGYGGAVVQVFAKLRKSKFVDPLQPAREQFSGWLDYIYLLIANSNSRIRIFLKELDRLAMVGL